MPIDYLIVGQGLAGSLLAWTLIQQRRKVIIVDHGLENASQVAAGIINPITGQRFVKSPTIDTLLPAAKACYAELSDTFKQPFYIEKPMLRLFRSQAEANAGLKRLNNPVYHAYLNGVYPHTKLASDIAAPFGGVYQQQTGFLSTVPLLNCFKDFFIAEGCYRQEAFDYAALQISPTLKWQNISPRRVIFCEGYQLIHNPWFSWLPLQPVKGEILTLQTTTTMPASILNYGHWLLPQANQHFRLGATFDREIYDTNPTEQGGITLLQQLNTVSAKLAAAKVIRHQAHIRPCSADREPFIGHHPQIPTLSVFNGFGAKGSLSIPAYSEQLTRNLLTGEPLPKVCDIQRYFARYLGG